MKRQITDIVWGEKPPRAWHKRAYDKCMQKFKSGGRDFLLVATPGAGKTRFNLWVGHDLLQADYADLIIVVVPSDNLRKQWALEATQFGLDLDPDFVNSQVNLASDYHGLVTTYASIAKAPNVYLNMVLNHKAVLILDEGHHMGENKSWGDAIIKAFENAVMRLLPSGTPFRSDDCKIPFVTYDNGTSINDFEYTYAEAIEDDVCRSVFFHAFDGKFDYRVGEEEFSHTFQDHIDKDLVPKRLRTALHADYNWIREVIQEAHKNLLEIRKTHRDAGGLIFAIDQKHAKQIAAVVLALTGHKPEIVTSEDKDGSGKIESFKNSYDCWVVCVKMISEGVDIPRLRVGVYATNVKAELFFRQAVGRFVRVLKGLDEQNAHIFIPKDRDIVKMAQEIEQEREHALEKAKKAALEGEENETLFPDYKPARKGSFVILGSEATTSTTLKVNSSISNGAKFSKTRPIEQQSVFQIKERIKGNINHLAKLLALRDHNNTKNSPKPEFQKYHKMWLDKGGKPLELETVEQLRERENWLKSLYENNQYRSN